MHPIVISYCLDGYNEIKTEFDSFANLKKQLECIKEETTGLFSAPFSVDIVLDDIGFMSIGLADSTILCYKSWDFEEQLTAVGDLFEDGNITFYFGDYSLMSKKYLIPYSVALGVLEAWIATGELSDKVEWTHELFDF